MKRVSLAHLPTPLIQLPRVGERLGIDLWIKRDDASGGVEAGNKIRKLELLLADALDEGADTVITCGGVQSNHARATAAACARLGLRTVLLLRSLEASDREGGGNRWLDALLGADVRFISADDYRQRKERMEEVAMELRAAGRKPYTIVEGGSDALGSLGYVEAMREVREQIDMPFDLVVVPCGSGGTAAGVALGAGAHGVARAVCAMAVCNDDAYFRERIASLIDGMRNLVPTLGEPAPWRVDDRFKGPAYGVSTAPQRRSMVRVAREAGLVLDPVYGGKAFHGLESIAADIPGQRVLFIHTGGLPGLLAEPWEV